MKKQNWKTKDYDIPTRFGTDCREFEEYVGRPPQSEDEMDDWVHYLEKGMEAQFDWKIINECASDNFSKYVETEEEIKDIKEAMEIIRERNAKRGKKK